MTLTRPSPWGVFEPCSRPRGKHGRSQVLGGQSPCSRASGEAERASRQAVSTVEDIGPGAAVAGEQHRGSPARPCARPGEACSCGSLTAVALAPVGAHEEAGRATEGLCPPSALIAAASSSVQHRELCPPRLGGFLGAAFWHGGVVRADGPPSGMRRRLCLSSSRFHRHLRRPGH